MTTLAEVAAALRQTSSHISGFRQMAGENNRSLFRYARDMAAMFAQHRSAITNVTNAIHEISTGGSTTHRRIDQTNILMRDMSNIQRGMLSELKNIHNVLLSIKKTGDVGAVAAQGGSGGATGGGFFSRMSGIGSSARAALGGISAAGIAGVGALAGAAAGGKALYDAGQADPRAQFAPGEQHNDGRRRRRESNEQFRQRSLQERSQQGGNQDAVPSNSQFVDPRTNPNVTQEIREQYQHKQMPVVLRNNNPGALSMMHPTRGFAAQQEGFVGSTPRPKAEGGYYARYATPEHGIAANARLLESYGKKGVDTPDSIVRKWSTDTRAHPAYAARLSEALGVGPGDRVDLSDREVQRKILQAKSAHESGIGKPIYNEDTFRRGVNREFPQQNGGKDALPAGAQRVNENQRNPNTIRSQPIDPTLKNQLNYAASQVGVQVEVYSGGQAPKGSGGPRTGSTRHDRGRSADLRLFTTNEKGEKRYLDMNNPEDASKMEKFVTESVRGGATGVGAGPGYMGTKGIHVGGGAPAAWGGSEWVQRAFQQGRQAPPVDISKWLKEQQTPPNNVTQAAPPQAAAGTTPSFNNFRSAIMNPAGQPNAVPAATPTQQPATPSWAGSLAPSQQLLKPADSPAAPAAAINQQAVEREAAPNKPTPPAQNNTTNNNTTNNNTSEKPQKESSAAPNWHDDVSKLLKTTDTA